MKIYTKTGDGGETSLMGGARISKDSLRIDAYGSVDELNAHLGVLRSMKPDAKLDAILDRLQNWLFVLGSDLAAPREKENRKIPRIASADVDAVEKIIDELEAVLEPLKSFILPGGTAIAAETHVARTVCRRAERAVVRLGRQDAIGDEPIMFLNRLSDLLFVMARYANHIAGIGETRWSPTGHP